MGVMVGVVQMGAPLTLSAECNLVLSLMSLFLLCCPLGAPKDVMLLNESVFLCRESSSTSTNTCTYGIRVRVGARG